MTREDVDSTLQHLKIVSPEKGRFRMVVGAKLAKKFQQLSEGLKIDTAHLKWVP